MQISSLLIWIIVIVLVIWFSFNQRENWPCPPRKATKNVMGVCFYTKYVCENGEEVCYPCRSKGIFKICKPNKKRIGEAACRALFGVGLKKRHSECRTQCNGWDLRGCNVT